MSVYKIPTDTQWEDLADKIESKADVSDVPAVQHMSWGVYHEL